MIGNGPHAIGLRRTAVSLLERGHVIAFEIGVPGGRVDLAVVEDGRCSWLFEVKANNHADGVPQLVRYASVMDGVRGLTLVVDPEAATPKLRRYASEYGVGVWAFPLAPAVDVRLDWSWIQHFPYLHQSSVDRMAARWRAERAAA